MWLINTETLELEEYLPEQCPPYAILSHRWEKDEVSFRDMEDRSRAQRKAGFSKIERTCRQANLDGLGYAWIDTCCINKESSAELSEAINSMFNWYSKAQVCYAFLSDVCACPLNKTEFTESVWFTRGWTLQELLAPSHIFFFNRDWQRLGSRSTLENPIQKATGIDLLALEYDGLSRFTVAQKMSWAARRETTRVEDGAYCLMGIFDVNMPLLYGEGHKAFLRLQEEIIRRSSDSTIFSWRRREVGFTGILASSPAEFQPAKTYLSSSHRQSDFMLTNRGLTITFHLLLWKPEVYIAIDCNSVPSPHMVLYRPKGRPALRVQGCAVESKLLSGNRYWNGWNHEHCDYALKQSRVTVVASQNHLSGSRLSRPCSDLLARKFRFEFQEAYSRDNMYSRGTTFSRTTSSKACARTMDGFRPGECSSCCEVVHTTTFDRKIASTLQPGEYGVATIFEFRCHHVSKIGFGVDFDGVPFLLATQQARPLKKEDGRDLKQHDSAQMSRSLEIQEMRLNGLIDEDYLVSHHVNGKDAKDVEFTDEWISVPASNHRIERPILPSRNGIWAIKFTDTGSVDLSVVDDLTYTTIPVLKVRLAHEYRGIRIPGGREGREGQYWVHIDPIAMNDE